MLHMQNERQSLLDVERALKALANKRRLAILKFIAAKGHADVGRIAGHIRLSVAATSRHLRILANAKLLESEQRSTTVFYFLPSRRHPTLATALKLIT